MDNETVFMDDKSGQKARRTTVRKWDMGIVMVRNVHKFNDFGMQLDGSG